MTISRFPRLTLAALAMVAVGAIAGCAAPTEADTPAATASSIPDGNPDGIPNGAYRTDVTAEQLVAAGASTGDAVGNAGVRTLTIDDGAFALAKDSLPDCDGTVDEVDGHARFEVPPGNCNGPGPLVFEVAWALDSGKLILSDFTLIDPDDPTLQWLDGFFTAQPWTALP